jgi:hypothetical protein
MLAHALRLPASRVLQLFSLIALSLVMAGCALNPIAAAGPDQKYDAVLLTYDAALDTALVVLEDPAAPANLRRSIQAAIATSGEIYGSAVEAYTAFRSARAEVAAGGPGTVLQTATANLDNWLAQLETSLGRLQALSNR